MEQIEELKKENSQLKLQVDEIDSISQNIESVHQDNSKLRAQLREYADQNEDLKHRLEISMQSKRELIEQIDNEKKSHIHNIDEGNSNKCAEIQKLKESFNLKEAQMSQEINRLGILLDKNCVEGKVLNGKLDKLMQAGQRYFDDDINSYDGLVNALNNPHIVINEAEIISKKVSELELMLKSSKQSTKKYKRAYIQSCEEMNQLQANCEEKDSQIHDLQDQNNQMQLSIHQLSKEKALVETEIKKTIDNYENQMNTMSQEINRLKNEMREILIKQKSQPIPISKADDEKYIIDQIKAEFETQKSDLIQRINEKSEMISSLQSRNDENILKIKDMEEKASINGTEKQKLLCQIESFQKLQNDYEKEIESLRSIILTRDSKQINEKEIRAPKKSSQNEINAIKASLLSKESQITSLETSILQKDEVIRQQKGKIYELTEASKLIEEKLKSYALDINELKAKLEKKSIVNNDDTIPFESWIPMDYPPILITSIQRIAHNSSLQPSSKLQHIYKCILKQYEQDINAMKDSFQQENMKTDAILSKMNKFVIDSTIALFNTPYSLEEFVDTDNFVSFITKINELQTNNNNMKSLVDYYYSIISKVSEVFGVSLDLESNKCFNQIQDIGNIFMTNRDSLIKKSKKYKGIKGEHRALCQKFDEYVDEFEKTKHSYKEKFENLVNSSNKLANDVKEIAETNKRTDEELNKSKEIIRKQREEIEGLKNQNNENLVSQKIELENGFNTSISSMKEKINQFSSSINDLQMKNNSLSNQIKSIISEKCRIENENKHIQEDAQERIKLLCARFETEKENIVNSYEETINQLSKKAEDYRSDINTLSMQISDADSKLSSMKMLLIKTTSEKKKLENDQKSIQSQMDREKKLFEASYKSKFASSEMNFNSKIEEIGLKFENEKRRILSQAINEFKKFYCPTDHIDERAYRTVISNVKDELTKLSSSDNSIRRMLNASPMQTTEDAVAQMIISSSN